MQLQLGLVLVIAIAMSLTGFGYRMLRQIARFREAVKADRAEERARRKLHDSQAAMHDRDGALAVREMKLIEQGRFDAHMLASQPAAGSNVIDISDADEEVA